MSDDIRDYLRAAQAAEIRGDTARAVDFLNKAASAYRTGGKEARAEQMLRHARRLEGKPEAPADSKGGETPAPSPLPRPLSPAAGGESDGRNDAKREPVERGPVLADPALSSWCSFCCRPDREIGRLVAGPAGAYICAHCLDEAASLLEIGVRPSSAPAPKEVERIPWVGQSATKLSLEATMRGPAQFILLVGPEGSGKTTCLWDLESRGLGHYIDLASCADGWRALPQRRLLADCLDRLDPGAQREFARVLSESPKRQVIAAVRGKTLRGSVELKDSNHEVSIASTSQLEQALGGRLVTELLDRVQHVVNVRAPKAEDLAQVARQLLKRRSGEIGESESLIRALAKRAARSPRGGHELAALIARTPKGNWILKGDGVRRKRRS